MSGDALAGRDVVCVGFNDWDNEVWTNQHHLMSRLAAAGSRVLFVESLGLRRPVLGSDGRRPVHTGPAPGTETLVPGRLEVIDEEPLTLLDGAHNPDGIAALAEALAEPWAAAHTIVASGAGRPSFG